MHRRFGWGLARAAASLVCLGMISACWGGVPESVGNHDGNLSPCPGTPNCVHTGLRYPQGTKGLYLDTSVRWGDVVPGLRAIVEAMPRTTIISETENYLHAEVRSRVFRFVDDLELLVLPDRELVVRSASRVGNSDFGVNAERVEQLRAALVEAGLLR